MDNNTNKPNQQRKNQQRLLHKIMDSKSFNSKSTKDIDKQTANKNDVVVVVAHSYDEDEAEIATFVDATIQDISNDGHLDLDDDDDEINNVYGNNNNDTSFHNQNNISNIIHDDDDDENENHTITSSINKSTDEVLSALLEDDDDNIKMTKSEMDYFYTQRKIDLQNELEEEKRRSKLELERLAAHIKAGTNDDDNDDVYEGNGVTLGQVEDYIGKLNVETNFDNVTLIHGGDDDNNNKNNNETNNDQNDTDNTIRYSDNHNNEHERNTQNDVEALEEDGISIDGDDNTNGKSSDIYIDNNNDDDSDIEFTHEQFEQSEKCIINDSGHENNNINNDVTKHLQQSNKKDRDEKVSMLRKNYQAFVERHEKEKQSEDDNNLLINDKQEGDESDVKSKKELYHHLKCGFDYVRQCKIHESRNSRRSKKENRRKYQVQTPQKQQSSSTIMLREHEFVQTFYQCPKILFVDPTSSNGTKEEKARELTSQSPSSRRAWNRSSTKPALHTLNIFSKINTLLFNRYDSSLKNIPYKNLRTNGIEVIESIPIRPMLNIENVSDPADWHKGPLCHVYIAACASIEHYRAKVRPFLKAFVNQIDGAGSGDKDSVSSVAKKAMKKEYHQKDKINKEISKAIKKEQVAQASLAAAMAKDAAGSSASSKYMIIYVPIHPSSIEPISGLQVKEKKSTTSTNSNSNGGGGGGGFFGIGRVGNRNNDSNSVKTGVSNDWSIDDDASTVIPDEQQLNPAIIRKLTKEQKEIFNKFCRDFPNAKTCLLSSLLDKDNELAAESDVQNQEMHEFLQHLGKVMISGFTDRVQSYNHEISRCKEMVSKTKESFDWCRYFLVKESLALTYEQLNLPQEALEEYHELELMLPSVAWPNEKDIATEYQEITSASAIGDVEIFREILRNTKEIGHLSYFSYKYLFARQARLNLLLKQPVSLIDKFIEYLRKVHFLRCTQCENAQVQDQTNVGLARVEAWVVGACWEMKSALESYFTFSLINDQDVPNLDEEEKKCINSLIDLLNFARMRLNNLGDLTYTTNNIISQAISGRPIDCNIPWTAWVELSKGGKPHQKKSEEITGNSAILENLGKEPNATTPWVRNILKSCRGYENVYLEISNISIRLNRLVGQMRCAARLSAEQAECHIIRGDFDKATAKLLPTIDLCMSEPWDTLLSWRLFRLICCQRISGNPPEYLRTLTSCFEPRSVNAMPPKLIDLLIAELEAVVRCNEISGHTWGLSPFLGVDVMIEPTKGGEIVESSNVLRKKVVKNVCYVGEKVITELVFISTLPRAITVDLKVKLLKLDDYIVKHKSGLAQENDDAISLDVGSSVSIKPGKNDFQLPWTVMTVGQYAIAGIEIQWENAFFMQDYCIPRFPALCFDVLPNEPTQSIELDPIFLIPGHIQNVRLYFYAGSDIVRGGLIELFCSSGVKCLAPGTELDNEQWESKFRLTLEPCQPGEKITNIVTVKCDAIDSYNANATSHDDQLIRPEMSQTLQAIVTTKYHHKLYAHLLETGKMAECSPMSAILQANVTTLERPALTISNSFANLYDDNNVIVNAIVHCNTPVPFKLKEWNISFPSPLNLYDDGDLNSGLFDCSVIEGEELFFGFKCYVKVSDATRKKEESALLNIVLQDHFGKTFLQVLPLDLDSFYKRLSNESSRSVNAATAQFSLASDSALVGQPVSFKCLIDCKSLSQLETCLIYSINPDANGDWVLGGKVRGKLIYRKDCSIYCVEFTGISTRPGIIKSFPSINLSYASSSSCESEVIRVFEEHPTLFTSLSHKNIDTFAFMIPEDL